jgi:hypothetical protein
VHLPEVHPSTAAILVYFDVDENEAFQPIRLAFYDLAHEMTVRLSGPELTAGLRKLLEARDCMIRAASPE